MKYRAEAEVEQLMSEQDFIPGALSRERLVEWVLSEGGQALLMRGYLTGAQAVCLLTHDEEWVWVEPRCYVVKGQGTFEYQGSPVRSFYVTPSLAGVRPFWLPVEDRE